MSRSKKIALSLIAVVLAWLMIGFSFTAPGPLVNTIMLLFGIVLFFGGILAAIMWGRK